MKRLLALAAAGAATAALALPAMAASAKTVKLGDDWFVKRGTSEPTVSIKKGQTVKWVWSGKERHNVFQVDGPGHFHSPTHSKSGTFKHKFTTKGTYRFVCTYHAVMTMKVKVS